MINFQLNKWFYVFTFCLAFCTSNTVIGQTVLSSIIPSKRMFEIPQISIKESFQKKRVKELPLIRSIRPVYRIENNILSVVTPPVFKTKVKKKKITRVYIMGSTVPVFKSVIPKIWPL